MKLTRFVHTFATGSLFVPLAFVCAEDIVVSPSTPLTEVGVELATNSSSVVVSRLNSASVGIHRPWRYELAASVEPRSLSAVGSILGAPATSSINDNKQDLIAVEDESTPLDVDSNWPDMPPLSTVATPPVITSEVEIAATIAPEVVPEDNKETPVPTAPVPPVPNSLATESEFADHKPAVIEPHRFAGQSQPVRRGYWGDRSDDSVMRVDPFVLTAAQITILNADSSAAIDSNDGKDEAGSRLMPALATAATDPLIILTAESGPAMPTESQSIPSTAAAVDRPNIQPASSDQIETRTQSNDQPLGVETPAAPPQENNPPQVRNADVPVVRDQSANEKNGMNTGGQPSEPVDTTESPFKGTIEPPKSTPVSNRPAEIRPADRKDVPSTGNPVQIEIRKFQADGSTKSTVTTTPGRLKKPTTSTLSATFEDFLIPRWFLTSVAWLFGYFWLTQFLSLLLMCKHDFPRTRDKKKWVITFLVLVPIAPFAFLRWKWKYYDYRLFPQKDAS